MRLSPASDVQSFFLSLPIGTATLMLEHWRGSPASKTSMSAVQSNSCCSAKVEHVMGLCRWRS